MLRQILLGAAVAVFFFAADMAMAFLRGMFKGWRRRG